jgi:uncharacterized protein
MKIDSHVLFGSSIFGFHHGADAIIKKLDHLEIEKCILCPVKPRGYHLPPENDAVASAVKSHHDRFIGFVRVDPRLGREALDEMKRGFEILGLKGLYLDPWEETFQVNAEFVNPLVEEAGNYGIPVMIKGGYPVVSQPGQIADLASRFPGTAIIATSGGQINICGGALEDARLMLTENKNISMETSGIYREDFIEEMARVIGAERLIYGSSSPVMDMSLEILRIEKAHLTDEEKKKIMGENIFRLLNMRKQPGA